MRADGNFASGMALGTRGQWNLMKRKWIDAYFDGKKAVKRLKRCVKLDEEYYEAYLGLGVFDYQAARLSGVAKLGVLLGVRGDEKRGIERIIIAADKSRYASHQAAQLLSMIYMVDLRDDARALSVVRRLRGDFPRSAYFTFLELVLRDRLGDHTGSIALARALHASIASDPKAFRPKWLTLVCGLSGEDCLGDRDMNLALAWLDRALTEAGSGKQDALTARLTALRGHALDILGRRDEALDAYRSLDKLPATPDVRDGARACLDSPCTRDVMMARLRAMSKEG
jgi:tetratricopeptide (TPR) repeat protein